MSILKELILLFKSDTKDLEEGNKRAKKSIDEVNKSLIKSTQINNNVTKSFGNLANQLKGLVLGYFAFNSILSGVRKALDYSDSLGKLSNALGVNIEELDAWGHAVNRSGGSVESFQQSVKSLNTNLIEFSTKGKSRASPFFKDLGIRMTDAKGKARNFNDVLLDLSTKFEKISKQKSFGIGQKIGLDQGTIQLLQQGRKGVEELIRRQKELGVITKQDADIAAKFNNQWNDTTKIFRSVFTQINSFILPAFTNFLKGVEKTFNFLKNNKHFVIGGIIAISAAITAYLLPALTKAVIRFAPFFAIGAAILSIGAAFALIYDDIMNFLEGNESLIGELMEKYPLFKGIIEGIGEAFKVLKTISISALEAIKELLPNSEKVAEGIKTAFIVAAKIIKFTLESIFYIITKLIKGIDYVVSSFKNDERSLGITAAEKRNPFGGANPFSRSNDNPYVKEQFIIEQTKNSALNPLTSASITGSSPITRNNTINIDEINIQTQATSSDEISSNIKSSLENQMRIAINNYDDGVSI